MKQGLIFDLDGTLIDSLPGIAAALNHALEISGFPVHSHPVVRRFIGNGSWVLAKRAVPVDTPDPFVAGVEAAFKNHYDSGWYSGTAPYPGIPELLLKLKSQGHRLAVLSNKPHAFTEAIVTALFPDIPFDVVLGQRAGIPHKPDPAGVHEIVKAFGLPAEDCVLIGDSTVDLETAGNAGIRSIAVTWGYHDRGPLVAAKPGLLVDDVESLLVALG
jgi:phosphoglycolate phosphatase